MKYTNVVLKRCKPMKLERKIAKLLRECQKLGVTIDYPNVGREVGLIARHKSIAVALGNLLWEDVRRGKPIRCSLVIGKNSRVPAAPYFNYLREMGFDIPRNTKAEKRFHDDRLKELGVLN